MTSFGTETDILSDYSEKYDKMRKIAEDRLQPMVVNDKDYDVIRLGIGKSFGDMALIQNKPRNATIVARSKCYFATLDKSSYERSLK